MRFVHIFRRTIQKTVIGTIPPGGVWGGGAPPRCRPPSYLVRAAAAEQKSCFKSAENCPARSLWIGDHRYMGILCASKLVWV